MDVIATWSRRLPRASALRHGSVATGACKSRRMATEAVAATTKGIARKRASHKSKRIAAGSAPAKAISIAASAAPTDKSERHAACVAVNCLDQSAKLIADVAVNCLDRQVVTLIVWERPWPRCFYCCHRPQPATVAGKPAHTTAGLHGFCSSALGRDNRHPCGSGPGRDKPIIGLPARASRHAAFLRRHRSGGAGSISVRPRRKIRAPLPGTGIPLPGLLMPDQNAVSQ